MQVKAIMLQPEWGVKEACRSRLFSFGRVDSFEGDVSGYGLAANEIGNLHHQAVVAGSELGKVWHS
jgi:hypothetical protein